MPELIVHMIDVGWGESLLLEHQDAAGRWHYALIDSNDSRTRTNSSDYIEWLLDLRWGGHVHRPLFDFVALSHDHADHGTGLLGLIDRYGTREFWYSNARARGSSAAIINYINAHNRVLLEHIRRHPYLYVVPGLPQPVDMDILAAHRDYIWLRQMHAGAPAPHFGDVAVNCIGPPAGAPAQHENNNSIILSLALGNARLVLGGDAERQEWAACAPNIPPNTTCFKVTHHGSVNGTCTTARHAVCGPAAWYPNCPGALLAISCGNRFGHPHQEVIDLFDGNGAPYMRTDLAGNIIFITNGVNAELLHFH